MRKLKLSQVRLLMASLAALALLLFPAGSWLGSAVLLYAGLICYILAALVWFGLYRCPHCHKRLGAHTKLYCPRCKKKL